MLAAKRRRILFSRVRDAFMDRIERRIWDNAKVRAAIDARMEEVYAGRLGPYRLVRELEETVDINDLKTEER